MVALFTLAPHRPFLDTIAASWLDESGDDPAAIADGLILLPTRRAARALADAFLRQSQGRALLLPRITALGAPDEAGLALTGALDLPPAIEPARRQAELARLVLAFEGARGRRARGLDGVPIGGADAAWRLAGELATLMDEAEREGVDLAATLPDAVDAAHAAHWAETLDFLRIVTAAWPDYLAANELMNPAARQVALLDALARTWRTTPPPGRVLAAGSTGGIPAVARLLGVIAAMPHGRVVLPGLDGAMEEDAWANLPPSHPQAGLARLLAGMGATRGDVTEWPVSGNLIAHGATSPPSRAALLAGALHPSGLMAQPEDALPATVEAFGLEGLSRLTPPDQQAEASAIAMILRDALEQPGQRAALVTPDRALAQQVAVELLRFGVIADDSAGEALVETPPAVFLRLLAAALTQDLAPVALLALLKHPLAAAGMAPETCRAAARALERLCLRGPRPLGKLTGLRLALEQAGKAQGGNVGLLTQTTALLAALELALAPALRVLAGVRAAPAELLSGLLASGEALAASDDASGAARLWGGEDGAALATTLAAAIAALPVLPDQAPAVLPGLLDALLADQRVRTRRALRGRDDSREHPRIFIWGLLEARLQSVDTLVLGGLAEGVWPQATDPGPWLSRPMRRTIGLPAPEQAVGQAAHDFVSLAAAAPRVVLSCPARREGAPVVPARWLERLGVFLHGRGLALSAHPAGLWPRLIDRPDGPAKPAAPPAPCPPLARRPRRLSVTEIETWLADPYAIHARHILRLRALDPLEQETDAADFGTLVHAAMRDFLKAYPHAFPADGETALHHALAHALQQANLRPALAAWWEPRLSRIATWLASAEPARRDAATAIHAEIAGALELARPGGPFRLTGRADRIERLSNGSLAILDYKTGTPPGLKDVQTGRAPQLPLEAVMAAAGAFGPEMQGRTSELVYWRMSGGAEPGKSIAVLPVDKPEQAADLLAATEAALIRLIDAYDHPNQPYLSQPRPSFLPRFPEYDQLARRAEWLSAGLEESGDAEDEGES